MSPKWRGSKIYSDLAKFATGTFNCTSSITTVNLGFRPRALYIMRGGSTSYPNAGYSGTMHMYFEDASSTEVYEINGSGKYTIGNKTSGAIRSITNNGFTFGTTQNTYGCRYFAYG